MSKPKFKPGDKPKPKFEVGDLVRVNFSGKVGIVTSLSIHFSAGSIYKYKTTCHVEWWAHEDDLILLSSVKRDNQ